jgi:NitT/TauT family transport system substrate-binding protein
VNGPVSRAAALSLTAAAVLASGRRAGAQTTTTIRICAFNVDSYAEPFYALEEGFLAKAGIALELVYLPNAGGIAQAVSANVIDIGMCDPLQVANPFLAGIGLAFFGGSALYTSDAPTTLLVVDKNSPIRAAKDFEGQTVAVVALASISSLAVREWLQDNGADQTKVKIVELPFAAMVAALGRGTIAGALLAEPFLSAGRADVRVLAKAFDAIAKSFYISSFFAAREYLTKNRDLARRFLAVMYDTARWANVHHAESAPILAKYSKLDIDRIRAMTRISYGTGFGPAQIQPVLDIAYKYKQLDKPVSAKDIIAAV